MRERGKIIEEEFGKRPGTGEFQDGGRISYKPKASERPRSGKTEGKMMGFW